MVAVHLEVDVEALVEAAMIVVATIVVDTIVVDTLHVVATAEVIEVGVEVTPRTDWSPPALRDFHWRCMALDCLHEVLSSFHQ